MPEWSGRSIVRLCAIVTLTALCLVAFASDASRARFMREEMHMNDFGRFYYSAGAFLDGKDMYAPTAATDLRLEKAPGLQLLNMNPPHFHLLILPLVKLPPLEALSIWTAASLFALVLSLGLINKELRSRWTPVRFLLAVFAILAFAGTQAFFGTGQLSMLLLLGITVSWLEARRRHWKRAAAWLGVLMSVKPFLLIFMPYLLGTRRFRAAAIAIGAAATCFVLGLVVFGVGAHQSWLRVLSQAGDWAWLPMNASIRGFFRRSFQTTPYFNAVVDSPRAADAWVFVAALLGTITLIATVRDKTALATDRAFALLLVAACLLSPLGWVYYLWLPAGPIAVVTLAAVSRKRDRHPVTRALIGVASVALLWPLAYLFILQPRAWATMTFGSTYFWGALILWTLLLGESLFKSSDDHAIESRANE